MCVHYIYLIESYPVAPCSKNKLKIGKSKQYSDFGGDQGHEVRNTTAGSSGIRAAVRLHRQASVDWECFRRPPIAKDAIWLARTEERALAWMLEQQSVLTERSLGVYIMVQFILRVVLT